MSPDLILALTRYTAAVQLLASAGQNPFLDTLTWCKAHDAMLQFHEVWGPVYDVSGSFYDHYSQRWDTAHVALHKIGA